MKFMLYRDPSNKSQKIPYAAMQTAGLASAEKLVLYADNGCVLLCRDNVSPREAVETIAHLNEAADFLMEQLVDASKEAASTLEEIPDCLDELDEVVLNDLLANGADPDGLRLLLTQENEEQESRPQTAFRC